jgi:hypothetical protein
MIPLDIKISEFLRIEDPLSTFNAPISMTELSYSIANFGQRTLNSYVGIIFIDIKKAFDHVDRNILMKDMSEAGIRGKMLRAVSSVICNSSLRVLFNDFVSSDYSTDFGTI